MHLINIEWNPLGIESGQLKTSQIQKHFLKHGAKDQLLRNVLRMLDARDSVCPHGKGHSHEPSITATKIYCITSLYAQGHGDAGRALPI
jgi:hypothetical protein